MSAARQCDVNDHKHTHMLRYARRIQGFKCSGGQVFAHYYLRRCTASQLMHFFSSILLLVRHIYLACVAYLGL